jgi:DivIVA domain-containing protein
MDRDEIVRSDFPLARRGYDQGSVDEHLRRVADALEGGRPLSAETSESVRAILAAAERSAAELRADAERRAAEHVARVRETAEGMLGRLDELQAELRAMVAALPGGAPPPEEDFAAPAEPPAQGEDEAAARITALNMALSGTPRDETAAYLAEHYELADLGALLDDVYAKAGG